MNREIYCPVCKTKSDVLYSLDREYIKQNLERYFDTTIREDLDLINYDIAKCLGCTLTFASPLKEGSAPFYSWVTKQSDYYPKDRWEYHKLYNLLKTGHAEKTLLDVGCGDGKFLFAISTLRNIKAMGVDTTPTSIEACIKKDLDAYCMDLDRFLEENSRYKEYFDFVVSFHCLEHIGTPISFLRSMLQALKPGGSIFISTPYSPMSFETEWFDPLNHPPHHMGRWNAKAYKELGNQLNLTVKFYMPEVLSAFKRARMAFMFSEVGFQRKYSKLSLIRQMLKSPAKFYHHLREQRKRERVSGVVAADVILVEFKRSPSVHFKK